MVLPPQPVDAGGGFDNVIRGKSPLRSVSGKGSCAVRRAHQSAGGPLCDFSPQQRAARPGLRPVLWSFPAARGCETVPIPYLSRGACEINNGPFGLVTVGGEKTAHPVFIDLRLTGGRSDFEVESHQGRMNVKVAVKDRQQRGRLLFIETLFLKRKSPLLMPLRLPPCLQPPRQWMRIRTTGLGWTSAVCAL